MKRILIVEDDGAIAAIERDYLMLSDFQVDIAATGPEGLAMGRSGGYDLILLDLMLPGLDGFALCSTLRETLDIPILMVTARQEDIDKIKGLGLGGGRLHHQALLPQCAGGPDQGSPGPV